MGVRRGVRGTHREGGGVSSLVTVIIGLIRCHGELDYNDDLTFRSTRTEDIQSSTLT